MRTGADGWKEFLQSRVWQDLQDTLMDWIERTRDDLESEPDGRQVRVLQGRASALRDVLNLPELLLQEALNFRGKGDAS